MTVRPPTSPPGGTVLVVDDNDWNRDLLRQDLEAEGFEVATCASGAACLATVATQPPDVILLDIQMTGMDGIETCRRLKADPATSHIPVLFVTGHRADDNTAIAALRAGGNDFLTKPYSAPILVARVTCQIAIARAQENLRRLAMTDELTGLYSRRYLFDALRRTIRATTRVAGNIACLLADVDHFKQINDKRGHLEGDRVLREIGHTIAHSVRETDLVARFGGEEFVVVLPHTDLDGALIAAEKVRGNIAEQCAPVTISVGATALPAGTVTAALDEPSLEELVEKLLRAADRGVYEAKARGRDQVCAYVPPA
jgi:diguanylate cyclase (GGDEF)-like protein